MAFSLPSQKHRIDQNQMEEETMRKDERRIFEAMITAVQGEDIGAASNAAMNVVGNLIVTISPSLEQAEMGAEFAAGQIKEMVPLLWNEMHGTAPPETTDSVQ